MKKIIASTLVIAGLAVHAAPVFLIGNLVSISGTSNSQSIALSPQTVNFSVFSFQNNGLANTNQATLNIQISTDNTNFTTVGQFTFSTTNAGSYGYYQQPTNIPVYMRVQSVTTTNTALGATYGN